MTSPSLPPLAGVLAVFQTPYHDDESIDFGTLEREIDWLYGQGARGLVMAMVSEVLRLSSDEREQLAEFVCRVGGDRGALVISVGAESGHTAERYARQAEAAGADAVMAIPPVSIALGDEETFAYYRRILNAVEIPVIVQDASGYVGRPMPVALQAQILDVYGDRVYFKPEAAPVGPLLSNLRDATGGRARVFEGSGGIALVDNHRRGVVGTMPGADLIDGIVALWDALEAGDDERAYRLSLPISALVSLQQSLDAFLAIEKHLLVKRGIFRNEIVRGPLAFRLDDETRSEVDRLLDLVTQAVEECRAGEGSRRS